MKTDRRFSGRYRIVVGCFTLSIDFQNFLWRCLHKSKFWHAEFTWRIVSRSLWYKTHSLVSVYTHSLRLIAFGRSWVDGRRNYIANGFIAIRLFYRINFTPCSPSTLFRLRNSSICSPLFLVNSWFLESHCLIWPLFGDKQIDCLGNPHNHIISQAEFCFLCAFYYRTLGANFDTWLLPTDKLIERVPHTFVKAYLPDLEHIHEWGDGKLHDIESHCGESGENSKPLAKSIVDIQLHLLNAWQ